MRLNILINKLSQLIELEGEKTREQIASFIVGELIGDYDGKYQGLEEKYPDIRRIAELASDLEWSNGTYSQLEKMWSEMCRLIRDSKNRDNLD